MIWSVRVTAKTALSMAGALFFSISAFAVQELDATYGLSYRKAKDSVSEDQEYGAGIRVRYSWVGDSGYGWFVHANKESSSSISGFLLAGKRWKSGSWFFDLNGGTTYGGYAYGPGMAPTIGYFIGRNTTLSLVIPCRFYDAPAARAQIAPYLGVVF